MAFHDSLQGTMYVVVFYGSSNKLVSKLERKCVFYRLELEFRIFQV
jgi:hypothetical protein